jgi:hypothetical protein
MPKIIDRKIDLTLPAGKGDKPRSCFSEEYGDNFDEINWGKKKKKKGGKSKKKY